VQEVARLCSVCYSVNVNDLVSTLKTSKKRVTICYSRLQTFIIIFSSAERRRHLCRETQQVSTVGLSAVICKNVRHTADADATQLSS